MPFCFLFYWGSIFVFVSSQQWFFLWMMMELSTITFLGMFFYEKTKMENAVLYFLIQSVASFFIIWSLFNSGSMSDVVPCNNYLLLLGLIMKIGLAPLHNWVVAVGLQTSKMILFVMLLAQKIIPFVWVLLMSQATLTTLVLISFGNLFLISPQNLFHQSLKMIIMLSTMSHSSWLMLSALNISLWQMYFVFYLLIMVCFFMFVSFSMKNMTSKFHRTPLFLIFLTLGGLPPFMGFYPKMFLIQDWSNLKMMWFLPAVLLMSVVDMFIYLRLSINSTMQGKLKMKWNKKTQSVMYLFFLNLMIMPALFL